MSPARCSTSTAAIASAEGVIASAGRSTVVNSRCAERIDPVDEFAHTRDGRRTMNAVAPLLSGSGTVRTPRAPVIDR